MILELLAKLFFGLIDGLLSLLPNVDINLDLGSLSAVSDAIGYLDNFVDVGIVVAIIGLGLIVNNWQLVSNVFNWIVRKIPTIG
jgi:hypothetical protein